MKILGPRVRVHPNLHCKVYAAQREALVGSANATHPGLQLKVSNRVEASVLLKKKNAKYAYDFAKKLFDEADIANEEHLRICKERFGRNTVSRVEAGEIESRSLVDALLNQPDIYSHLPVIFTDRVSDREVRDIAWNDQREDLAPDSDAYDPGLWANFDWRLPEEYDGEICLSVHMGRRSAVVVGLVRPHLRDDSDWTFARRVDWSNAPGLIFNGLGPRSLSKGARREEMRRAWELLEEEEHVVLYGRDLVRALKSVSAPE